MESALILPPSGAERDALVLGPSGPPGPPEGDGRVRRLGSAVEGRRRVRVAYEDAGGEGTTRTVRPLGLFPGATDWRLVAWCELRGDFRTFRVDRIVAAQPLDRFRPERGQGLSDFLRRMERDCEI